MKLAAPAVAGHAEATGKSVYHHYNDQGYRNKIEGIFANRYDILVSKSVQIGDIDPGLQTETVRQKIRALISQTNLIWSVVGPG